MGHIVNKYIQSILFPMLEKYGLDVDVSSKIGEDIGNRLNSIISRWNDTEFRSTILFHGLEEAYFYEPKLDINIRSLVVVGVRNSLLEDVASTVTAAKSLGLNQPVISDKQIKDITSMAISFFGNFDLEKEQVIEKPTNDPFSHIPEQYPIAWEAMKHLCHCTNYKTYKDHNNLLYSKSQNRDILSNAETFIEVQSGMDPNIDKMLEQILERIIEGIQPFFFSDSFKMISRNADKLYKVMECVLSANAPVVTVNYYLCRGYVARRTELLKPAHHEKEIFEKIKLSNGIRKIHLEVLKQLRS